MDRGAAWWEFLVIGVVMLLTVVFIIQPFTYSKIDRPEAFAISSLRTISSAQELYNTKYETYGTLNQLENANMIDNVLAQATSPVSAKSGYYYTLQTDGKMWCCTAGPATFGLTGERNFMITNEGIIYFNSDENSSEFTEKLGG